MSNVVERVQSALLSLYYTGSVTTAESLRRMVTPYALGVTNNDISIPSPQVLTGDPVCSTLIDRLMTNPSNVDYWIRLLHTLDCPPGALISDCFALFPTSCQSKTLPVVRMTVDPEQRWVEFMTVTEAILYYDLATIDKLVIYIYSVGVFGFMWNEATLSMLELDDVMGYLAARCFQGELDKRLNGGIVSSFIQGAPDLFEGVDMSGIASDPKTLQTNLQQQMTRSNNLMYTSNATDEMMALEDQGVITMPERYSTYLRGPLLFPKVGPALFSSITRNGIKPTPSKTDPKNNASNTENNRITPVPKSEMISVNEILRKMAVGEGTNTGLSNPSLAGALSGLGGFMGQAIKANFSGYVNEAAQDIVNRGVNVQASAMAQQLAALNENVFQQRFSELSGQMDAAMTGVDNARTAIVKADKEIQNQMPGGNEVKVQDAVPIGREGMTPELQRVTQLHDEKRELEEKE